MAAKVQTRVAGERVEAQMRGLVVRAGRDDLDVGVAVRRGANSDETCVDFAGNERSSAATILLGVSDSLLPADRLRRVLAHELGHVIRRRDGVTHFGIPSRARRRVVVTVSVSYALVWLAVGLLVFSAVKDKPVTGVIVYLTLVGMFMITLALPASLRRDDERQTDALAARVFGAVLTVEDVVWLEKAEGRSARILPTVFRGHPRPAQRRTAGLEALSQRA